MLRLKKDCLRPYFVLGLALVDLGLVLALAVLVFDDVVTAAAAVIQALVKLQMKMGSDRESRKRPWEENELSSLAKAIVKFPAGSQNRE